MARPHRQCPICLLGDSGRGRWSCMPQDLNWYEMFTLMSILQVFSPAKVIFAGVGVLLLVRFLLRAFVRAIVTPAFLRQQRMFAQAKIRSSTSSNAWNVFPTSRNLHRGAVDAGNDRYHYADHGRGTLDSWDCHKRAEAGEDE